MSGRGSISKYSTAGGKRWRFRFDGPPNRDGSRRQVQRGGFRTQAAALEALDKARSEWAGVSDPSELSTGAYLREWVRHRAAVEAIRPATADQYLDSLQLLGDVDRVPLLALTATHLDRLYSELSSTGGRTGTGRSASTVRKVHAVVRKGLADALRKGLVPANVADAADPPTSAAAKADERAVWDAATGFALIRWPELEAPERAVVVLAMLGGLRRGEIAGLRWSDLDGDRLQVARTVTLGPSGEWAIGAPKTAKGRRWISLPAEALAALEACRREQLSWFMATGHRPDADPLLVSPRDLEAMMPEEISRVWRRLVAAAVAAEIVPAAMTLHDGRHWCGTHLVAAGVDPRTVSEILGHADPAFTLRTYAHTDDDRKAAAAQALGAMG